MINNLKTVDSVIAKLQSYFNIQESLNEDELIEWIADAYGLIGSAQQLVDCHTVLHVKDYKAKFPCPFHSLISVDSKYQPAKLYSNTYEVILGFYLAKPLSFNEIINYYNYLSKEDHTGEYHRFQSTGVRYRIKYNYIYTDFKEGLVELKFKALPFDEKTGFPLVPEDEGYDLAFIWYCAMWLSYRGIVKLPFNDCEARWKKYCNQARGNANMPDNPTQDELGFQYKRQPSYNRFNG